MFGDERSEGLVKEGRVRRPFSNTSGAREEIFINGGAHSDSCHATIMPRLCHADPNVYRVSLVSLPLENWSSLPVEK